ncbi:uncharacterized protein [Hetaerina americana]|uniref:uncharacterized protein isoform X2 n=1 Tax=Hetaerina americana TaxID=62018 RepID=UPI003A7F25B3
MNEELHKQRDMAMALGSRSEVWHYFNKLGYHEAQCKICKAVLQKKGSTSALWGHLRARHVSVKTASELSEAEKYSCSNIRDREPLTTDGTCPETSEAKIEGEGRLEDKTWAVDFEATEDPSQESLPEKCQAKSISDLQHIKMTGVATTSYDVQNYLIKRLNEAEAEKKYTTIDEDENFCRIIGATMKKLTPMKNAEVKIKIMQLLFDAQFGESNDKS